MTEFEDKICTHKYCNNILTGQRTKFCSMTCNNSEYRLRANDKLFMETQIRISKSKEYSKTECKFCKDSSHTEFCSFDHEYEYDNIMLPIDLALGR